MAETGRPPISVAQGVSLGLALIVGGLVWRASEKAIDLERSLDTKLEAFAERFVSRDVFTTEMGGLRREAEMRQSEIMRRLDLLERGREVVK